MNRKLLLALQKRTNDRLTELRKKLEKNEVREEDLEAVQTEVDELAEQAQDVADALENLDEEPEDTPEDEPEDNPEDDEPEDTPEDERGADISPEKRSNIMSQIGKGLSTRGHKSTKNKEKEIRSAFAKFVVGQISETEARSLGIDAGNGGVVIPEVIASEIITYAQEENLLRKYGSVVRTKGNVKYPVLVKKANAHVNKKERALDNPIAPTDIEFDEIYLDPAEFDALATVTKKLINMTGVNVENIVIDELKKAYVRKETNYMFNGDDVGNENPGALTKKAVKFVPSTAVEVGTEGWSQVLQDELTIMTGQPVTEIIKKAKWIVNRAAYNLLNRMTDVNGRKLLTKNANGIFEYDGFPLDFTDAANKSEADVKTPVFYFGDFKAFHIQDVIGALQLQKLVEKYADTNRIGFQIYNLLDGQLVYSPFEPAVYRYEITTTP